MIETGGGRFDRDDRHAFFLAAGVDSLRTAAPIHPHILVAVNELKTPKALDTLDAMLDGGAKVLLDSGVFNLTMEHKKRVPGMTMDQALTVPPDLMHGFLDLWRRYTEIADRFGDRLWGYVEVDQGGAEHKRRLREQLQDRGLRPIPVFHPMLDGWDYFDELAENYDRLCYANVSQATRTQRKRHVATAWERHRAYPNLWIHLLGFTPNTWLAGTPVDSADSSAWLAGLRWTGGQVIVGGGMRALGDFPRGFRPDGETTESRDAAVAFSAFNCAGLERTWRRMVADRDRFLDQQPYPEPDRRESPCLTK